MKWIVFVGILLAMGCSKNMGSCLQFADTGHGNIKISAGPWGEVGDVNMTGPARYSRVPKDMTIHPCMEFLPVKEN